MNNDKTYQLRAKGKEDSHLETQKEMKNNQKCLRWL